MRHENGTAGIEAMIKPFDIKNLFINLFYAY